MTSANSPAAWDAIWAREGRETWRGDALAGVYDRIVQLTPKGSKVVDLGGGIGVLATRLRDEKDCDVEVWDHSPEAVRQCCETGITARIVDLCAELPPFPPGATIVATEVLEHLPEEARERLLRSTVNGIWSVPNNRLGPDEESQHTIKWTAKQFFDYVQRTNMYARVECVDEYLIGFVGDREKKQWLSVCFPARDEEDDIERTLRSFRGVADQLVVGIDPRSKDRTEEIVRQYADVVFELDRPWEGAPTPDGINFARARNQCIERCSGDWIFMTEAHESLAAGQDILLHFATIVPAHVGVIFVTRSGQGMEWLFPWLTRNDDRIRYDRPTHNQVQHPECIGQQHLRQVRTLHRRSQKNAAQRKVQRKAQNRLSLFEDWKVNGNADALFYVAQEWRSEDPKKAAAYYRKLLATHGASGSARYQSRLVLAKLAILDGDRKAAREALVPATGDDWQRTEHFMWIGDLAFIDEQYEQALAWYRLAGTRYRDPPLSTFWFDTASYGLSLSQRMVTVYAVLGQLEQAETWTQNVIEDLPDDAPSDMVEEAQQNLERIREVRGERQCET